MKTSTWIIILLAVLLVVGILYFDKDDFAQDMQEVGNAVEENVDEVVDEAEEVVDNVDDALDNVVDEAEEVVDNVDDAIDNAAAAVAGAAAWAVANVADGAEDLADNLEEGAENLEAEADDLEEDAEEMEDDMDSDSDEEVEAEADADTEVRTNNFVDTFDQASVDTDLSNGERVALFFHADRCPSCVALESDIMDNMEDLENVRVYKVNYDEATELKDRYGVTAQHTIVFLDENGDSVKSSRTISTAAQLDEESL